MPLIRNNFRYILIDADNTLFDFEKAERYSYFKSFKDLGIRAPGDQVFERYHEINQSLWYKLEKGLITKPELALERHRLTFVEFGIEQDPSAFNLAYLANLGQSDFLIDGANNFCSDIRQYLAVEYGNNKQCFSLCIVTNGIESVQLSRFNKSEIHDFFDNIYVSEAVGYPKPDKRYFDFVFNDLKIIDLSSVLVIGDSLTSDIQGANNACVASCWFNPKAASFSGDALPDYTVNSFSQIINLFFS